MNRTTTFWFGLIGALLFIGTAITGGFLLENYSHIKQLISESYAIDTTYGVYLRFFGYIPSGILIALFSFSSLKFIKNLSLARIGLISFGIFYGIGSIIVSIFPCDSGCNKELINPSISQFIHNVFGALTYLIVPICLILIGINAKKWNNGKYISNVSFISAAIAILFSYILGTSTSGDYIGLFQRIVECSFLFWLISFAFYIKKYSKN